MVKGAFWGAIAGPAVFMGLIILEGCFDFVFKSGFWTLGTLRLAISLTVASAAAGAFSGAVLPFVEHRLWIMVPIATAGGSVGGAVFWIAQRPATSLKACVVVGTLIVPFLLFLGWLEDRTGGSEKNTPETVMDYSGPSIECPKCSQQTRNPSFCEICGRDIRKNPPPLVLPDGTVVEHGDS